MQDQHRDFVNAGFIFGERDERSNYLTVSTAAPILGLRRTQVWRLAKDGTLPHVVLGTEGKKAYFFKRSDVDRVAAERAAAGIKPRRRTRDRAYDEAVRLFFAGRLALHELPPVSLI